MPSESGQGRNWHTGRVLGLRIPRGQIGSLPFLAEWWPSPRNGLSRRFVRSPAPSSSQLLLLPSRECRSSRRFSGGLAGCLPRPGGVGGFWRRRRVGRGPLAAAGAPAAAAVESPSREAWPGMRLASSRARGSPVLVLAGAYSLASELEETGQTAARPHTTQ